MMIVPEIPPVRRVSRSVHTRTSRKRAKITATTFSVIATFAFVGMSTAAAAPIVSVIPALTSHHMASSSGFLSAPCSPGICLDTPLGQLN
jgi:hypothetical protein